ncbi:fasciclin domain protein [Necator americanus]|uniref:Fasciclin domain protein n=1 Tax=Necator americanus TaxID=51031 RepID=W2SWL7_NECAM|nr:fasciclin domain protein [Necator americanus]ETN74154.1 fasciclin domain protein [Necator americanus]
MFLPHLLLCLLLTGSARAKCSICSLFSDYYDDVPLIRTAEGSHDSAERVQQRAYHSDSSAQEAARSFGRFSDLTSSLFGNLFNLLSERTGHVASDDGSSPLKGKGRLVPTVEKAGKESKEKVADQIFNIFDTIGSGIIQMTHLEGPHICTRESTKKWPADGSSLRSEKRIEVKTYRKIKRREIGKLKIQYHEEEICMKSEVSDAKSYVLNRVVPGTYRAYDWTDGTVLKTVSGGELVVSQADETFGPVKSYVNCVPLESTSVRTQNGVVHVLTGDLTPASETVVDALKSDPRFDLFVSVISEDLRDLLSSNESFTVFAPSRKVLSSLSKSLFEDIREGRGCASGLRCIIADFARSHIVRRSFCSSQLLHRRLSSLAGGEIDSRAQIKNGERVIQIGRARLVGKEIFAKNGVVHEIDDILFSDELLSWREHLEVHNHELAKVMEEVVKNSTEPVTIFVPPGNDTLQLNKELAKNHIVVGEVLEDFQRPSTLTTEAGSVVRSCFLHCCGVYMFLIYCRCSPDILAIRLQFGCGSQCSQNNVNVDKLHARASHKKASKAVERFFSLLTR